MDLAAAFRSIGITKDYGGLDLSALPPDMQGWNSEHGIFRAVLGRTRAGLVIEAGTWKGASVAHMHRVSRALGLTTQFVCVDTWLGSNVELWLQADARRSLNLRHGYPDMFPQFVSNMIHAGIMDDVFPLPMTTTAAARLLGRLGVVADAVYVDAGHEEEEVYADLCLYHDLLRPGGVLFGDDYAEPWPGVVAAVNRFAAERRCLVQTAWPKFMMVKHA